MDRRLFESAVSIARFVAPPAAVWLMGGLAVWLALAFGSVRPREGGSPAVSQAAFDAAFRYDGQFYLEIAEGRI